MMELLMELLLTLSKSSCLKLGPMTGFFCKAQVSMVTAECKRKWIVEANFDKCWWNLLLRLSQSSCFKPLRG